MPIQKLYCKKAVYSFDEQIILLWQLQEMSTVVWTSFLVVVDDP